MNGITIPVIRSLFLLNLTKTWLEKKASVNVAWFTLATLALKCLTSIDAMIYSIFYFKKNTQNLSELMIFLNDFLFDIYLIRFKCHNLNCNMHFLVRIQKVPFLHQFGVRVCSLAILDASSGSSDSKLWAIMAERRRHKKRIQV